jgi:hypothetical protein
MSPEISEWGEGRVIFFDTVLFEDFCEKKRAILEHTGVIELCLDEGGLMKLRTGRRRLTGMIARLINKSIGCGTL